MKKLKARSVPKRKAKALKAKKLEVAKLAYMDLVDYQHHLEDDSYGTEIYPDIESLRRRRKCVDGCGIVEVSSGIIRIVKEQKL